ncbi:MAG: response regulator transcription factor [Blastocatellia bacterium]|nr:response regulator transcription factor [Blastocatellia bacterium]
MSDKIRVLIADDERPAREFLKAYLAGIAVVELVAEAENGTRAVELIREHRPDLAILDLQMPEMTGFEVVRALTEDELPLVAFVTAYDDHAVRAFELNAVDYLLKPVEQDRLNATIERAIGRLSELDWRSEEAERLSDAAETYDVSSGGLLERIPVRKREEFLLIPVGEVASIVADGELLKITTGERQSFTINYRLKDIETRLGQEFVRLSRGSIVNLNFVDRLTPVPGGTYVVNLTNGEELQSSRIQSKYLRSRLLKI